MTGIIGLTISVVDAETSSFIKELQTSVKTELSTFLTEWKRGYRAQQLELKRKKYEENIQDRSTLSIRPSRNARLTAMENIKKQAVEEDLFLKPKAMPRTKAKKKLRETEEPKEKIITEEPETAMVVDEHETKPEPVLNLEEADVIINEPSPPISPVPFPDGARTVINESPDIIAQNKENDPLNVSVEEPKTKKRKGKKGALDETFPEELNKTVNLRKSSRAVQEKPDSEPKRKTRVKRTKNKKKSSTNTTYDDFAPKAESSMLIIDLTTPKNASRTFVVNLSDEESSPFDIFGEGAETVRSKKPKEVEAPISVGQPEFEFQLPLPVAQKQSNEEEVHYDAMGNVIERDGGARTKVITAPTFKFLPDAMDGRPVRTRTKVRRLGVAEDGEKPTESEQSNATDASQRVKRTKKKSQKTSENNSIQEVKTKVRKSKVLQASIIHNKGISTKLPLSSNKKFKTPLSSATHQLHAKRLMIMQNSVTKECPSSWKKTRIDEPAKVIIKQSGDQMNEEREEKIKTKIYKEEVAALKKQEELNRRQEQLKQKNKEKLARAKECRAKIEEEKYEMIVQAEKEKEMKRKLLLQERELKLKAEKNKKKMLAEKKLAELEERRRIEEEMRLAKIRELELEQERQHQEKMRHLELEEKRARERIEEKKKIMEADKLWKLKMAQAAKVEAESRVKKNKYDGMYLPRNENDYGLDDELSESSGDEEKEPPKRPVPKWVSSAKKGNPLMKYLNQTQLELFMPISSKTPNVQLMLNMTPKRTLRRTSSAVWNATIMPSPS